MLDLGEDEAIGWCDPKENVVRYFGISGGSEEVKLQLIRQIKALNGKVCENGSNFELTCTHLLCEKPEINLMVMSCIVSGKWLLGYSYIEESFKAGRFLVVMDKHLISISFN